MNNDIIGKEVVFYENNTWNHIMMLGSKALL